MRARTTGRPTCEQVLQCESLPTLPVVAMELLEKTSNPDVAMTEIAELIQSDPGLAGQVLKTVNSSFYGLPKPCPSIDRAIGMLGLRAVKSLVLGFSMVNLTQGLDDAFDMQGFWRRTIIAAAGARQVAVGAATCDPDEAFAAALFQDMGMLAIFSAAPVAYARMIAKAGVFHNDLFEAEQEQFGYNHTTIGAELAERWRMPEQVIAAIQYHHTPEQAADHAEIIRVVALGSLAARAIVEEETAQAFSALQDQATRWFGWGPQELATLLEEITGKSREVARMLGRGIGQMPDPQQLLAMANQRLVEQHIQVQRESATFEKQARDFEQAATTDGLTGIANRKRFDEVVGQAMAQALKDQRPIAVLFSDADNFKSVNDTYGHHAGDLVLMELARRLTQTLGSRGTVCRYGGEEFAVVLPGIGLAAGAAVGEELRSAIADRPFNLKAVPNGPDELTRTVSVGVAAWQPGQPKTSAQELVQRADKAVYFAKEIGRNNVKRWGDDLNEHGPLATPGPTPDPAPIASGPADVTPDLRLDTGATHVMVIEDDALSARLMEAMFQNVEGVDVTLVNDGRKAVQHLRNAQRPGQHMPDLIVSDMNLPGFTGIQILKALKANPRFKAIPVVMVSASDRDGQLQRCLEIGAMAVYSKTEICTKLRAWCEDIVSRVKRAA